MSNPNDQSPPQSPPAGPSKKKVIACFGGNDSKPGEPMYEAMRVIGRGIGWHGHECWNGGFGGCMEAVSAGAREAGGKVVGFTMLGRPGNGFLSETCGLETFNGVDVKEMEHQFGLRLGHLLRADGFIVAAGGLGTFGELIMVLNLCNRFWPAIGLSNGKPFAILKPEELNVKGWDPSMIEHILECCGCNNARMRGIGLCTSNPGAALNWVDGTHKIDCDSLLAV